MCEEHLLSWSLRLRNLTPRNIKIGRAFLWKWFWINPVYKHVLVQEDDITDVAVWWLEDDLEEELELTSRTPCGVSQSSTIGTKDQTRVHEDLLSEWFQVQAELGIADAVKVKKGDIVASHMRTETNTESLPAEWSRKLRSNWTTWLFNMKVWRNKKLKYRMWPSVQNAEFKR